MDNNNNFTNENDNVNENNGFSNENNEYSYIHSEPIVNVQSNDLNNEENFHKWSKISMILGIIAVATQACCISMCCFGISTVILGIISLVFAVRAKKISSDGKFGGMALAGLICSIVALSLLVIYYMFAFISGLYEEALIEAMNEALAEYGYEFYPEEW